MWVQRVHRQSPAQEKTRVKSAWIAAEACCSVCCSTCCSVCKLNAIFIVHTQLNRKRTLCSARTFWDLPGTRAHVFADLAHTFINVLYENRSGETPCDCFFGAISYTCASVLGARRERDIHICT